MTTLTAGENGTLVTSWVTYAGGPAVDVTAQTITIKTAAGATQVAATAVGIVHLATGLYSYVWAVPEAQAAGDYVAIWDATDAALEAVQASEVFTVEAAATNPGDAYVTLAELKAYLGITNSGNDTQLDDARAAASRAIEQFCQRQFNKATTATARVFYPETCHLAIVDDFWTTTGLVVATDTGDDGTYETALAAAGYQLEPLNGVVDGEAGWPYYRIRTRTTGSSYFPLTGSGAPLQVTAQWGWAAVPSGVKQACFYLAVDLFKLRETQFGVMGAGEWGLVRVRDNPKATALLQPYRRTPVLVG